MQIIQKWEKGRRGIWFLVSRLEHITTVTTQSYALGIPVQTIEENARRTVYNDLYGSVYNELRKAHALMVADPEAAHAAIGIAIRIIEDTIRTEAYPVVPSRPVSVRPPENNIPQVLDGESEK